MIGHTFSRLPFFLPLLFSILNIGASVAGVQDPVQSAERVSQDVAPPQRQPIRVGGNVQALKLVNRIEPVYPEEAKKAHIQGTVVLQVTINEKGEVWEVRPISGHVLLKDAAINAVRQWRYQPTEVDGVPVPVIATVTVMFVFKGDDYHPGQPVSLFLRMDEAGILWDGNTRLEGKELIDRAVQAGGSVRIVTDPKVPLEIIRETVQSLSKSGIKVVSVGPSSGISGTTQPVDRLDLLFASVLETARKLGYRVASMSFRISSNPNSSPVPDMRGPLNADTVLQYGLNLDETSQVTSVKQVEGPNIPEITAALLKEKISTAALSQRNLEKYPLSGTAIVKIWIRKD
jgi:TonB family protein